MAPRLAVAVRGAVHSSAAEARRRRAACGRRAVRSDQGSGRGATWTATPCGTARRARSSTPGFVMTDELRDALGEVNVGGDDVRPGLFQYFHTDDSYVERPALVTVLHARALPSGGGGDTCFLDMHAAYELLEPETATATRRSVRRARLQQPRCVSATRRPPRATSSDSSRSRIRWCARIRTPEQPALYFDLDRAKHIEGLPPDEGRALLAVVAGPRRGERTVVRACVAAHDVLVWDNARCSTAPAATSKSASLAASGATWSKDPDQRPTSRPSLVRLDQGGEPWAIAVEGGRGRVAAELSVATGDRGCDRLRPSPRPGLRCAAEPCWSVPPRRPVLSQSGRRRRWRRPRSDRHRCSAVRAPRPSGSGSVAASDVSVVPVGEIIDTDVQSALASLDGRLSKVHLIDDLQVAMTLVDDFMGTTTTSGTIGTLGWASLTGATGTITIPSVAGGPGIVQASTGTTSTGFQGINLGSSLKGAPVLMCEWRIRLDQHQHRGRRGVVLVRVAQRQPRRRTDHRSVLPVHRRRRSELASGVQQRRREHQRQHTGCGRCGVPSISDHQ